MGLFDKLRSRNETEYTPLNVSDQAITAPADGKMFDVSEVSDEVFAQKMLGDSVAFRYDQDEVILCAPANGTLSVMFPTGHAFGVTMKDGVEFLVHIGINTVNANGEGFKVLKKQGEPVKAGEPVVKVNMKKLKASYDMSTILIITDAKNRKIRFKEPCEVKRGDSLII